MAWAVSKEVAVKKGLVLAVVLVLGLGTWAFAVAPFSGSWKTTIGIDVSAGSFGDFFTKFNSSLSIDYTIDSWVFGSKSTFGLTGYSAQSFTAAGTIGAFSFSSTMAFAPMLVSEWTYPNLTTVLDAGNATLVCFETQTCPHLSTLCALWKKAPTAYEPAFLTWEVTGSVSIAGVTLEGLFFLDQSNIDVTTIGALFEYGMPVGADISLYCQTNAAYMTCASSYNGSGWRFKVSGVAAGMTITSYTYFNLYEYTISEYNSIYGLLNCPSIGMSGLYEIDDCSCDVSFTREYITIEGFGFGCATIDFALDITCDGFSSLTALVQDVMIGGWLDLDFSITFETDSKSFASCFSFAGMTADCFIVEVGFASGNTITDTEIDSLVLHGVGLSYTWNGVSFASYTELTAYSALFSKSTAWSYLYGPAKMGFLVPFVGYEECGVCYGCCIEDTDAVCYDLDDELYELKCVAEERLKLWEKFQLKYASDACCGGAFSLTLDTYFGDDEVLEYVAQAVYDDQALVPVVTTLYGTIPSTITPATDWALSSAKTCDYVSLKYGYTAGDLTTLFNWAKSAVAVSFGLGSNFMINIGAAIDAFGWESLDFGFTATF